MTIEIYTNAGWVDVTNPEIYTASGWQEIEKGEIWNGSIWQTFYERFTLVPQAPTVSNVSTTVSHLTQASITFKFQHPGEPDRNTPVKIEYRLKNSSGTVIQTGEQTFSSGAINQNVTFSNLAFNSLHTFEARAVYTTYNQTTAYAQVSRTTLSLTYSLTTSPASSVNEGSTMTATFTTNDTSPRTYYWRIQHSGNVSGFTASANDFSLPRDGSFSASTSANGAFSVSPIADSTTEGAETFGLEVAVDPSFFGQVASVTRTINDTSQTPAPTYSMLPSTTSFSRGGGMTISVSTTNVSNGTLLYWRRINGTSVDSDFLAGNFEGAVSIQNNSATIAINTAFLDVTPGSFHQTITTTTNSFDWRARVSTIEGYRGNATYTVRLYTDALRTNQVATTSNITITPEPYNVGVQVNTGGNFVTQYFIPGQFSVTTGEVNDLRTISGLSPLVTYVVTVTSRYTSRSPQQFISANDVTRSTFRNVDNLSGFCSTNFFSKNKP
jgi:hypothetical protein